MPRKNKEQNKPVKKKDNKGNNKGNKGDNKGNKGNKGDNKGKRGNNRGNNKGKNKGNKGAKYKKTTIPKAIREQCWLQVFGETFKEKCYINWCENDINVFDFHVGHDKPESEGGTLDISNLKPICARCNLSMSNNYTIKQWNALNDHKTQVCCCCQ